MATTVIGVFDDHLQAEQVIGDLLKAGIERNEISILSRDSENPIAGGVSPMPVPVSDPAAAPAETDSTSPTAATGAIYGGLGGLLLGLGALAIPGVGPVIAAGPIAAALTGAGIGAAGGAVVGALTDAGVSEHDAHYYADSVSAGRTLVSVTCDDTLADPAAEVMNRHGARDVEEMRVTPGRVETSKPSTPAEDTGNNSTVSTGSMGASNVGSDDRRVRSYPRPERP